MDCPIGDVLVALLGTGQFHAVRTSHQPTIPHRVSPFRMKLKCVASTEPEGLYGKGVAFRQQFTCGRQIKAFAMPLIDVVGPIRANLAASFGRSDRIVADLGVALRMGKYRSTEMAREHLRAETNAEIRLFVPQRHADPIDFAADKVLIVVRTLRATENRRTGVLVHCLRQRVAEPRASNVERIAEVRQSLADAARRGMLLMQNEKYGLQHG